MRERGCHRREETVRGILLIEHACPATHHVSLCEHGVRWRMADGGEGKEKDGVTGRAGFGAACGMHTRAIPPSPSSLSSRIPFSFLFLPSIQHIPHIFAFFTINKTCNCSTWLQQQQEQREEEREECKCARKVRHFLFLCRFPPSSSSSLIASRHVPQQKGIPKSAEGKGGEEG